MKARGSLCFARTDHAEPDRGGELQREYYKKTLSAELSTSV